jgi:hypothetical protein
MHIVNPHIAHGILVPAVHIAECLKAVFLAGVKLPINRAFLINFTVVFEKVLEEIQTDLLSCGRTALNT